MVNPAALQEESPVLEDSTDPPNRNTVQNFLNDAFIVANPQAEFPPIPPQYHELQLLPHTSTATPCPSAPPQSHTVYPI